MTHTGETGGKLNCGYIVIDTTASNGSPATMRRIVYEGTPNTAITVPTFCGINATIVGNLDIDGACIVDPMTDGLLVTLAMMGPTGATVTNTAIGAAQPAHRGRKYASISTSSSWRNYSP